MNDLPFSRRDFLKSGTAGVLLAGVAPPVVAAQSVAEDATVYVGSFDNNVSAVDAVTGDEQWVFNTGSTIQSSPTVVDGTVYFGSQDSILYAVEAATGDQQWDFNTGSAIQSSPTVVNDTVYIGTGSFNTVDNNLYAVNAATGDQRWVFDTGDGVRFSSPTVVNGTVYIGSDDSNLYAVDAATGDQRWAFKTGDGVFSSPTVVDGTVYVGSQDSNLYAVEAATGDEQWAFETGDGVLSSPAVVDGTVYVGSYDGALYALDATDGTEKWRFDTGDVVFSSPTVTDGTIYIGNWDHNLYAVEAGTGDQLWAFDTGGTVDSSPTVIDGTVYVGSQALETNNLYAVEAATGDELWAFDTGGIVKSSPTVVADPATGDSVGSRVNLGTLGHHQEWTDNQSEPSRPEPNPDDQASSQPEGFDPATHGFGFANWSLIGDFDPPHNHETIAEDTFKTQFEEDWLPEIKQHYPLPLPGSISTRVVDAHYETLRNGPESLYSDGHCYGMCLVVQQYFEDGVPKLLSNDSDTAADIPKPTGDYVDVGNYIDEQHRTQALDFDTVKEAQRLSPASSRNEQPIDAENEVRAIQSAIEQTGTALVGIGSSPTSAIDDRLLHQVLAYNIDVEGGESLTDADTAVIDVYDPNDTASYYRDNSRSLEVDVSVSSLQPIRNGDFGYRSLYHRFALIGPSRTDFKGQIQFGLRLVLDYFSNLLDGFVHIVARSPVRINAVAPDGERFERPGEAVDGVPPSEHLYLTGATPGEYEIQIEGTDDGDYTLDILGTAPTGGGLEDSFTGTINEGERQTLTATLPDESGGEEVLESSDRPDSDEDAVIFGFSRTELATGGLVSVAMVYAAVRMLSDSEDGGPDSL